MKPIKIKDLTWAPAIYPRTTRSRQTINAYAEALEIGAQFPQPFIRNWMENNFSYRMSPVL